MHFTLADPPVHDTSCDEANDKGAIDIMTANTDKTTNNDETNNTDAVKEEHTVDEPVLENTTIDTSRFG